MKKVILFLIGVTLLSCEKNIDPNTVIASTLEYHGNEQFNASELSFTFRGEQYKKFKTAAGDDGYSRHGMWKGLTDVDSLWGNQYTWTYAGVSIQPVKDSVRDVRSARLNSVLYFASLPFKLTDPAVNSEFLSIDTIKDKTYHKIRVTFDEAGGGEDHEDIFIYWFDTVDASMDYLAYSYCEKDCGYRFRESISPREINGVVVSDWINYKPKNSNVAVENMQQEWLDGNLEKLSEIILEDVKVKNVD